MATISQTPVTEDLFPFQLDPELRTANASFLRVFLRAFATRPTWSGNGLQVGEHTTSGKQH